MNRFVWRLQRVLEIKKKQEQAKRAELLKLSQALAATQGELLSRQQVLMDIIARISAKEASGRLPEQEFFLKHCGTSDEAIKELRKKVCELEAAQRAKIVEVLKIRQLREGLERLRAEAKKRFIKEQEKLEQKQLDERATVSFARKILVEQSSGGSQD